MPESRAARSGWAEGQARGGGTCIVQGDLHTGLSLSCLTISWGTALMTEKRESSAQFRSHITIYTILFIHILENKDLADSGIL